MRLDVVIAVLACCWLQQARASELAVGGRLPPVAVSEAGELVRLPDDEFTYRPWRSNSECGMPQVVQHLAGRMSAKRMNQPFVDALEHDLQPRYGGQFQVTTIVNIGDTLWGTAGLVQRELKANKLQYPDAVIVADATSAVQQVWKLQQKSVAVAILSADCQILFFREGRLSQQQIGEALQLLEREIRRRVDS